MDSIRRGCPGRPSPLWAHFGSEVWLSDAADILSPCKSREARRASLPHDSRSCSKMDADGIPPSTVRLGNTPSPAAAKGFSSPVCIPVRRGGTTTRPQSGPLRFRRRARRPTGAAARESCSWAFHWTLLEGRTHTSRGGWSRARGQPSEGGPCGSSSIPSAAQAVHDRVPRRRLQGWGKAVVVCGCGTTTASCRFPACAFRPPRLVSARAPHWRHLCWRSRRAAPSADGRAPRTARP